MTPASEVLATIQAHEIRAHVAAGDPSAGFDHLDLPEHAMPGALSWLRSGASAPLWGGSVLIAPEGVRTPERRVQAPFCVLSTTSPRLALLRVLQRMRPIAPMLSVDATAVIHPTAILGEPGLGYVWTGQRYERMPHCGGVRIGAEVEIGPLVTVQRGVIGPTMIGDGSKIGASVNVGHGVRIGKHCLVSPMSTIGGSATLGDRVTLWQGAMVANGVRIGDGATIGMGSVVLRYVPAGERWGGNPARRL